MLRMRFLLSQGFEYRKRTLALSFLSLFQSLEEVKVKFGVTSFCWLYQFHFKRSSDYMAKMMFLVFKMLFMFGKLQRL